MQVRIRLASQTFDEAKVLDDIDVKSTDDLNAVIRRLAEWGLYVEADETSYSELEKFSGQFVLGDSAYFEITVHDD